MTKYNFLNLAPDEFELLCKDLLQAELGSSFENFKPGRDGGVDLRAWIDKDCQIIAQCKRYSNFNNLVSELKQEVAKVKKLNPSIYIVCTSLPLSPLNKEEISKLFGGLLHQSNIYSNSDLNSIISRYPEIERRHYKLWLASTAVLQTILNNKVHIQSQNEQEQLEKISRVYVMNDSFEKALALITTNKFVILSGNPGVGKTTLARVLAYEFIKSDFQLVIAVNSIKEAWDLYSEGTDQVILFDDFLGRNILEGRYPLNEEHQLINFIEKVSRAKNKVLILTTREYILNQAKTKYEIIKSAEIDISKCVVDVSKYTKYIKAKILYNHLYFASLPAEHIQEIFRSKVYLKIVEHKNYNPRIIETIVKRKDWTTLSPSEFCNKLKDYFDKPYMVWQTAYESEINALSRILLLVLITTGTPVLRDDLRAALDQFATNFSTKYDFKLNDFTFSNSIKELHNTFVITRMDSVGSVAIEFQNPSIYDFLINYLSSQVGLQEDLITSAIFFEQFFEAFTSPKKAQEEKNNIYLKGRIPIANKFMLTYQQKLIENFENLRTSKIRWHQHDSGKTTWNKDSLGIYNKLDTILRNYLDESNALKDFSIKYFRQHAVPERFDGWEQSSYVYVLKKIKVDADTDPIAIMTAFTKHAYWAQQLSSMDTFKELFPIEYDTYTKTENRFRSLLREITSHEINSVDDNNRSNVIEDLERLAEDFNLDLGAELLDLKEQQARIESTIESSVTNAQHTSIEIPEIDEDEDEESVIIRLFASLI